MFYFLHLTSFKASRQSAQPIERSKHYGAFLSITTRILPRRDSSSRVHASTHNRLQAATITFLPTLVMPTRAPLPNYPPHLPQKKFPIPFT